MELLSPFKNYDNSSKPMLAKYFKTLMYVEFLKILSRRISTFNNDYTVNFEKNMKQVEKFDIFTI
jgi:hypothetical protein